MPSKKVVSIFIICSALVFVIIILNETSISSPNLSKTLKESTGIISNGPEIKLTDNYDWQSDFSKLSPPSDLSIASEASSTNTTETLTDEFARSFMANYLSLKQSNSLNQTSANKLLDKSINFIESPTTLKYQIKDISITPDNGKFSITKYGNDLGLAFKINRPTGEVGNEIDIFGRMMEKKDKNGKEELQNMASIYKKIEVAISKIITPSNFSTENLKLLNDLNALSLAVYSMSSGLDDPLKSLSGLQTFVEKDKEIVDSILSIRWKLLKSGANYKQADSGYFLYFGI